MTSPFVHLTDGTRELVRCIEYGPIDIPSDRVLGPDGRLQIDEIALDRFVDVRYEGRELSIKARGTVGIFALTEEISVQVWPRFPVENLTHMVSACGYVPTALAALRGYATTDVVEDWALNALTDSFLVAMGTIEELGLLREYVRRSDLGSYPHGRIDMGATVNRFASRDVNHKVAYSWFEQTVDTPANRCLREAAQLLQHAQSRLIGDSATRDRISRLGNTLRLLEEVSEDPHREFMDAETVRDPSTLPDGRAYYRPALELALSVLSGKGIDLDHYASSIAAGSLTIETYDVFEEFTRLSLDRALAMNPALAAKSGKDYPEDRLLIRWVPAADRLAWPEHIDLGVDKTRTAEPDILLVSSDGSVPIVADVKYTHVSRHAERSELEQVVTYAVRYRSPIALTIHPRHGGAKSGLAISGYVGGILVGQYRLDLAADDLDAEFETMARSLEALIAATSATT